MKILFTCFALLACQFSIIQAQTPGCTDPKATNYNSSATVNNGSCTYGTTTVSPTSKFNPPASLDELSGMVFWNDKIYCHRDNYDAGPISGAPFYEMDTLGNIIRTITLNTGSNVDWEDIAQDNDYLYIGDFGNNVSGNRQDLKIYRISKSSVSSSNTVTADIIEFQYPEQTSFTAVSNQTTDFDCEAMIVMNNKIYLFTKQWTSKQTALYEIPNVPGVKHPATLITTFNVNALVTGADNWGSSTIVLTGYTQSYTRFVYLLYDFAGNNFFSGNKRKIELNGGRILESVAYRNNEYIYIGNEAAYVNGFLVNSQLVESVNLTPYLDTYNATVLPISTIDLKARVANNVIQANWIIKPSSDLARGELQRKTSAENSFRTIYSFTTATGGYNDASRPQRSVAYRIKAQDTDGKIAYSSTVSVNLAKSSAPIHYRNGKVETDGIQGTVEIYTITGRLVSSTAVGGHFTIDMQGKQKGAYVARLKEESGNMTTLRFIY